MNSNNNEIEFEEYVGLAGDSHCSLTIVVNGVKKGSTLYNRTLFPVFNKNRAKRRLEKLHL